MFLIFIVLTTPAPSFWSGGTLCLDKIPFWEIAHLPKTYEVTNRAKEDLTPALSSRALANEPTSAELILTTLPSPTPPIEMGPVDTSTGVVCFRGIVEYLSPSGFMNASAVRRLA